MLLVGIVRMVEFLAKNVDNLEEKRRFESKDNGGSYDVRFVGPNGVDTFNMIGDYYTSESNDPYDND